MGGGGGYAIYFVKFNLPLIFGTWYFEMVEVGNQTMMTLKKKVKMEKPDDENGRTKKVRTVLIRP